MKTIYEILQVKQAHLAELQKQMTDIQREVDALKLAASLLAEDALTTTSNGAEPTQPEMIREVMKESGAPMHVKDIATAIKSKYHKNLDTTYLTAIIYRGIKKGKLFSKSGPNTFGLLEWQITRTSPSLIEVEKGRGIKT